MMFLVYTPLPDRVEEFVRAQGELLGDNVKRVPDPLHSTLYVMNAPRDIASAASRILARVSAPPLEYRTTRYDLFGDAFVMRCEKTGAIEAAHFAVLDALKDFPKETLTLGETEEDHARSRLYGSHFFGDSFNPHVTIARVHDPLELPSDPDTLCWRTNRFVFARKNESGWETLAEYDLSI